ncbi:MAG: lipoprotein NlpD [Thalassolituus sp.]|jgi:lipoprotein NlpD
MKMIQHVTIVTLILFLGACSGGGGFVSVDKKFSKAQPASGFHLVREGETLYSIAWRYGLDYRELANANSISSPHTIYPGQKIDVRYTASEAKTAAPLPVRNPSKVTSVVSKGTQEKPKNSHMSPKVLPSGPVSDWQWPTDGAVIDQFSTKNPVNKGIDIAGSLGESVLAAAAGTVVYAGTGLRGYGNLVIIRHNEKYLSAYAHASRINVTENQDVKAGEKIAETGSTGTDKVKLHFEIRESGKPVNPLKYLPARRGGG